MNRSTRSDYIDGKIANVSLDTTKVCHDCKAILPYHSWIQVRCTLDNEDTTYAYCFNCYAKRSEKWLLAMHKKGLVL